MSATAGPGASLSAKQERFVEEYLVDLNATQAAIRAGYSKKTAHVIGHENLRKPKVAEAIAQRRAEVSEETGITQKFVLGCITDAIEMSQADKNVMGIYRGAELLGKHLGMFEGQGQGEEKAQPLRFDIHVNAPAGSVRVTKPE